MHVRVRCAAGIEGGGGGGGSDELIVPVPSRLSRIEQLRKILVNRLHLPVNRQRLFYGGKLLEDGYTLHDYSIRQNDVIQLMPRSLEDAMQDDKKNNATDKKENDHTDRSNKLDKYDDAESELYRVGDLVDAKDMHSAWFEGKIKQIVKNPDFFDETITRNNTESDHIIRNDHNGHISDDSSVENGSNGKVRPSTSPPKKSILNYFSKVSNVDNEKPNKGGNSKCISPEKSKSFKKKGIVAKLEEDDIRKIISEEEKRLVFRVLLHGEDEILNYKLSEIRPRARNALKLSNLKVNTTVMVNYNPEEPNEKGLWYDFTVHEIRKQRKYEELLGTLYHGNDIMLHDTRVKCHDKIFSIETVIPLVMRTEEYNRLMITDTEKRNRPLNCTTCRDNPKAKCKDCGCYTCAGKDDPDKIILCDECNLGFHLVCLDPPLLQLPDEDWYCSNCRRDTDDIIAPGKGKQVHKPNISKTQRDWGRGMACVGKTQTCAMPANHFGPIPGIDVGMIWRYRIQLSESGVHRPPVSGIHGRDVDGAYSIVLSGGYEDDVDYGFEFTYTGSGGRDLSGNKRTADQSSDQALTRENRALAKNCAVREISEDGADAGDNWRDGKPVRVSRSYKMLKHFPEYSPREGVRYDGIYKVVKYYSETGKSGFKVWKYLLRRDDPNPAPWEENAKKYSIVYPDGYLEAEAEKRAEKAKHKSSFKKGILKENNSISNNSTSEVKLKKKKRKAGSDDSPPPKRMTRSSIGNEKSVDVKPSGINATPKSKNKPAPVKSPLINPFTLAVTKKEIPKNKKTFQGENKDCEVLSAAEKDLIEKDVRNKKLWTDCLELVEDEGRQGLVNRITTLFLCIICQELVANPVTTNCNHNFCTGCLKLAFKSTETHSCSYCRADLSKDELLPNELLKTALQTIMPGYDNKRK
ncbi:E3 ubiquitin-protein ligase UHRF1-like [Arctopsyche grandis]|uniref:E3 ubiquitin-protein ligase UHRF1-like n=1 Tax=Arctopsyche grandis TaxID=121162 RepID=UPI00406D7FFE